MTLGDPHDRGGAPGQASGPAGPEDTGGRKPFLVRLPLDLHAELRRWAAADLRSLNGQIEFLLRAAVQRRKGGETERNSGP